MSIPSPDTSQNGYGKLAGGSGAGALAVFAVWAWNSFLPAHPLPAEMAAILTVVFTSLGTYLIPHNAIGGS